MSIMKKRVSSRTASRAGLALASLAFFASIRLSQGEALRALGGQPAFQTEEESPVRRVELLVLDNGSPTIPIGLHVELGPGWYLYWLNPGDAGLAPEVRWTLPPDYVAGKLRFPTPEKLVHGDIVTYGFTGEVLILCDIQRPASPKAADKAMITAVLGWMACQESCVTGESTAQVNLSGLLPSDLQKATSVLSRFSKRYPQKPATTELKVRDARLVKSSGRWTVEILLAGRKAELVSDFFPYPLDDFVIDLHGIAISGGKLIIPVEPANSSAALSSVGGLLIIEGHGYEVSIPIRE